MTERWLAAEAERRARRVAEELREATVALTRSLDRETVLATLLERLQGMVPFDRASVMLLEETSRLSVRAIFDGDRVVPLAPEVRSVLDPTDHPIVRDILTTGTAVLIADVHALPDWSLPIEPSAEACWLGVPLFARGDVAGLFSLSKREPGYFNQEHVRLAEAMSSQASVAVEDDGVGFEADRVLRGDHLGLLGLRERAEALDGTLTVESAPGAGTCVVVEVPSAGPHPDR